MRWETKFQLQYVSAVAVKTILGAVIGFIIGAGMIFGICEFIVWYGLRKVGL